jgi:hypothetical protein
MMKNKTAKLAVTMMALFVLLMPVFVFAAVEATDTPLDTGVSSLSSIGLGTTDVRTTIGSIIRAALGFLGVVAVVIVLIGGFKYMTSGGNEEKAKDARKYITYGIIGLAIILAAYAITTYVISNLITATA